MVYKWRKRYRENNVWKKFLQMKVKKNIINWILYNIIKIMDDRNDNPFNDVNFLKDI